MNFDEEKMDILEKGAELIAKCKHNMDHKVCTINDCPNCSSGYILKFLNDKISDDERDYMKIIAQIRYETTTYEDFHNTSSTHKPVTDDELQIVTETMISCAKKLDEGHCDEDKCDRCPIFNKTDHYINSLSDIDRLRFHNILEKKSKSSKSKHNNSDSNKKNQNENSDNERVLGICVLVFISIILITAVFGGY